MCVQNLEAVQKISPKTPCPFGDRREAQKGNDLSNKVSITNIAKNPILSIDCRAPVKSLVYDTPYTRANQFSINLAVELYKTDLEVYCHRGLPRFTRSRSSDSRADSAYLYLVRQCPYLHTLVRHTQQDESTYGSFQMIRERISSSTVLLLTYTGKNLRYFHLRRNAIILKCDWPKSPVRSWALFSWEDVLYQVPSYEHSLLQKYKKQTLHQICLQFRIYQWFNPATLLRQHPKLSRFKYFRAFLSIFYFDL